MYPSRNNDSGTRARTLCRALVVALTFLALAAGAGAQPFVTPPPVPRDDPGRFAVLDHAIELSNGVYFLDALIEYRLSTEAREALLAGVPLTIRLDLEVVSPRRFWFDNEQAELDQRFELVYRAVTERFVARNLNSGAQESFPTLQAALGYLGRIEDFPIIDAELLEPDERYDLRLRTVLDVEEFPGPLRLLAFWRRDWSIGSGWYQWRLPSD